MRMRKGRTPPPFRHERESPDVSSPTVGFIGRSGAHDGGGHPIGQSGSLAGMKGIQSSPELIATVTKHREIDKLGLVEIASRLGLGYPDVFRAYRYGRCLRLEAWQEGDPEIPPIPARAARFGDKAKVKTKPRRSGIKSRPNLYRLESNGSYGGRGWRLHLRRNGAVFTHYFSDLRYGSPEKSLAAGEKALCEMLALLESSRCGVNNRISASGIKKARRLLRDGS